MYIKFLTIWGGAIGMLILFCIILLIFNPFKVEVQADYTDNSTPPSLTNPIPPTNTPFEPIDDCNLNPSWMNWPDIVKWEKLMETACIKHGVPVDLIAALMLQESGGDPSAYSNSGAVGLLQIMPSDGISSSFQCINGPCFANRPTIEELKDPEFNLNFGVNMLRNLIENKGSYREALKSYGPLYQDTSRQYEFADKVLSIYTRSIEEK